MNYPLSVSNRVANNVLMNPVEQGPYDLDRAGQQWLTLYRYISQRALVYVLPGHDDLQDLPFTANLACYLPHLPTPTILLSRFQSMPRRGEERIGKRFFEQFGYNIVQPPRFFEGEADLKWVRDNLYVGGVGRSTPEAFQWMRERLGMEIIEVTLNDPALYHLDCVFTPLSEATAIVNTAALSADDLAKLAAVVNITAVPEKHKYDGWTNGVLLGSKYLTGASIPKHMIAHTQKFDLSEFEKSGADLSCLVMHLNHR